MPSDTSTSLADPAPEETIASALDSSTDHDVQPNPVDAATEELLPVVRRRSGGPRTPEGKAASSRNALIHGIYSNVPVVHGVETDEQWTIHRMGVGRALRPQSPLEEALVERIASLLWRLRRVLRYETSAAAIAQQDVLTDAAAAQRGQVRRRYRLTADAPAHADFFPRDETRRRELARYLQELPGLYKGIPVQTDKAASTLTALASVAYGRRVEPNTLGLPDLPPRASLYVIAGWTAETVRRCLDHIAAGAGLEPQDLVDKTLKLLQSLLPPDPDELPPPDETDPAVIRLRRQRLLPPADITDRVMRYESHLTRQLNTTLRQLDAIQARGRAAPDYSQLRTFNPAEFE